MANTASSTRVHLLTSTAIIAGPVHPSTREASIHKLLFDFMRGFSHNHGGNQEQEEEMGRGDRAMDRWMDDDGLRGEMDWKMLKYLMY